MIFFILYCSNKIDIINDSVEDCSPLAFIEFEYLYAASNISLNNSRFGFLKIEANLFHLSISLL